MKRDAIDVANHKKSFKKKTIQPLVISLYTTDNVYMIPRSAH